MFQPGQLVRVNLAGLQAEGVMFQAAVTDAVGHIVKQTSEQPSKYLVKLLFSFRGVTEVEVPADRIRKRKWNREKRKSTLMLRHEWGAPGLLGERRARGGSCWCRRRW